MSDTNAPFLGYSSSVSKKPPSESHPGYLHNEPTERRGQIRDRIAASDLDSANDLVSAHIVANLDGQAVQCARRRGNDVHDVPSHLRIVGRIEVVIVIEQIPGDAGDDNDRQYNNQIDKNNPTHVRIPLLSYAAGDSARKGNVLMSLVIVAKRRICSTCCQFGAVLDDSLLKLCQETNKQNALLVIHGTEQCVKVAKQRR